MCCSDFILCIYVNKTNTCLFVCIVLYMFVCLLEQEPVTDSGYSIIKRVVRNNDFNKFINQNDLQNQEQLHPTHKPSYFHEKKQCDGRYMPPCHLRYCFQNMV